MRKVNRDGLMKSELPTSIAKDLVFTNKLRLQRIVHIFFHSMFIKFSILSGTIVGLISGFCVD